MELVATFGVAGSVIHEAECHDSEPYGEVAHFHAESIDEVIKECLGDMIDEGVMDGDEARIWVTDALQPCTAGLS